ncbi:MAG TPA: fasciclin domain-containing protein [Steroidobacteraceae bacterium]|nr:fasciclin domain-containing protein [Steroidobacteraceae bacterium]
MNAFGRLAAGAAFMATISASMPALADDTQPAFTQIRQVDGTIVDVAAGDEIFSTLVTALQAADLVSTLQGPGPFTVFAPTNEAFEKIPPAVLNYLLSEPDGDLASTLLYHVVPGVNDVRNQYKARDLRTVQGQEVFADREGDRLWINNARVKGRVIQADNGLIYVIDSVLLPQYR